MLFRCPWGTARSDSLLLFPIAGKQREEYSHPPVCEAVYNCLANGVEKLERMNVEQTAPSTQNMFMAQKYQQQTRDTSPGSAQGQHMSNQLVAM